MMLPWAVLNMLLQPTVLLCPRHFLPGIYQLHLKNYKPHSCFSSSICINRLWFTLPSTTALVNEIEGSNKAKIVPSTMDCDYPFELTRNNTQFLIFAGLAFGRLPQDNVVFSMCPGNATTTLMDLVSHKYTGVFAVMSDSIDEQQHVHSQFIKTLSTTYLSSYAGELQPSSQMAVAVGTTCRQRDPGRFSGSIWRRVAACPH